MSEELDDRIAEYLNKEENLHSLRQKILNLEGYRLKSELDDEMRVLSEEKGRVIDDLKKKHKKAMEEMVEAHERELRQLSEEYEDKLRQKARELQDFQTSVESCLNDADKTKGELARWQNSYGELEIAYQNFSALSEKHRQAVDGIFGGCATPMDFLYGSVQKGHLEQLWDYLKGELESENMDEQEGKLLTALFDFSFDAVNRSQNEPLYRTLDVPKGSAFNNYTMGRTATSPQLGRVKQLVFAGFSHEVTGSVVRRSLVRLE